MALVASLLATLTACCSASKVVLRNNGYEGVVVALEDDLPSSLCQDIALGLEVSECQRRALGVGVKGQPCHSARDRERFSNARKVWLNGLLIKDFFL